MYIRTTLKHTIMKVTQIQYDIAWGAPAENMKRIETLIDRTLQTDLIVLPEMWSTGFDMEPETIAEGADGASLQWMKQTAARLDCAVAGSIATIDSGEYRNRFYFVRPDGQYSFYDKHHLFSYAGENRRYTPGKERVVVEWRGVRIMLLVCYDMRFPVYARCVDDYDMMLVVANWPVSRQHSWNILTQARAMENQCYLAAVNRIGTDGMCEYTGGTSLINPYGDIINRCPDSTPSIITTDIDMEMLQSFRRKFPVLQDSDRFRLID